MYVYDTVFGIIGERLVGVANIPLRPYCKKVLDQMNSVSNIFKEGLDGRRSPQGMLLKTLPQQINTKWGSMLQDGKFKHKIS